jgi:hypothetical protein
MKFDYCFGKRNYSEFSCKNSESSYKNSEQIRKKLQDKNTIHIANLWRNTVVYCIVLYRFVYYLSLLTEHYFISDLKLWVISSSI